jgi:ABC-type nitrate/sulfonate/bicarbonate transport system substrate-binding protein
MRRDAASRKVSNMKTWILGRRGLAAAMTMFALAGAAHGEDLAKVSISMTSSSIPAATARIAKQMGLFEKHGLDADVKAMDSGNIATMGLISGSTDFVTTAVTDAVLSRARGQDVVALTTTYHGFAAVVVLSKAVAAKLGVSPTSPINERLKALDGLTIASPSPTSSYTVGPAGSVQSVGGKIKFVYMSQPAMVAALQTGAIQGFIASAPYYAQAVLTGVGEIWIAGPKGEFPSQFAVSNSTVLLTTNRYAAAHPDIIKRIVDTFQDLGRIAAEKPDEVKAALGKIYPEIDAKQLDILFDTEVHGFMIGPLTTEEIAHDTALLKASGANVPNIDSIKPSDVLYHP